MIPYNDVAHGRHHTRDEESNAVKIYFRKVLDGRMEAADAQPTVVAKFAELNVQHEMYKIHIKSVPKVRNVAMTTKPENFVKKG